MKRIILCICLLALLCPAGCAQKAPPLPAMPTPLAEEDLSLHIPPSTAAPLATQLLPPAATPMPTPSPVPAATLAGDPDTLLGRLPGRWLWTGWAENDGLSCFAVDLFADGTAVVDGRSAAWQMDAAVQDRLQLRIYDGDEEICALHSYDGLRLFNSALQGSEALRPLVREEELNFAQRLVAAPELYAGPLLQGTWVLTNPVEGAPQTIVFTPQGTCTLDGRAATWELSDVGGGIFRVEILIQPPIGGLGYYRYDQACQRTLETNWFGPNAIYTSADHPLGADPTYE